MFIKIQHEINDRLDALEKKIGSRKFKDKQEFIKGAFFELQDLKEWIVANGVDTKNEPVLPLQSVTKRFLSWGNILIGFIAGVFGTIIALAYIF
jgi:hypothetical protein